MIVSDTVGMAPSLVKYALVDESQNEWCLCVFCICMCWCVCICGIAMSESEELWKDLKIQMTESTSDNVI